MLYYARATRIQPLTLIQRERLLKQPGELLVRNAQELSAVQVIAQVEHANQYAIISVDKKLGISPQKVQANLKVEEGQAVQEGMPLVQKPGILNRKKFFRSPVNGTLVQGGWWTVNHSEKVCTI